MQKSGVSEFSLRMYLQGAQLAALEYIMVEFGLSVSPIVVDAIRLHVFLEESRRRELAVWGTWRNALFGTRVQFDRMHFYQWHNLMWRMLDERSIKKHREAEELILTQFSRHEIEEWAGSLGERYERNPTHEIRCMLGSLYFLYLEYQRGGSVQAFIWGKGGEPILVDVREFLQLSDTRP